jgi:hypothetical protein
MGLEIDFSDNNHDKAQLLLNELESVFFISNELRTDIIALFDDGYIIQSQLDMTIVEHIANRAKRIIYQETGYLDHSSSPESL